MKRLLYVTLCVLMLLLVSCEHTAPSPFSEATLDPNPSITMRTVYPVYGNDCEWISVIIENGSTEDITFGEAWTLEKRSGEEWVAILPLQDAVFNSIAYTVGAGEYAFASCYLPIFTDSPRDGHYRIVKEIDSEHSYTAEFDIGESPITASTPHGFVPLEELPEEYAREQMIADGVVVIDFDGIENADRLTDFLRSANHHRFRGQLRIAHPTYEGDLILADVIIERHGRIDYICDDTRDAWGKNSITTQYFSHIVTDGENIYLTNHGEYRVYDENVPLISGVDAPQEAIEAVENYTYFDKVTTDVWSPNGEIHVSPGKYGLSINTERWGMTYVGNDNIFTKREIIDLIWQDNTTLLVKCEADGGMYYYEFIHIDASDSNSIRTLSHTLSAYDQTWHGGEIVIPE